MPKMSRKQRKAARARGNRTSLGEHRRDRQQLIAPLNDGILATSIMRSSWIHERLPEMLWASLIIETVGRDYAIEHFREILKFIFDRDDKEQLGDLTLTGIAKLGDDTRDELIFLIASCPGVGEGLACLLIFDGLPAREDWLRHLSSYQPDTHILMMAVGKSLWHQSVEATDCRWVRVMGFMAAGKMHFPPELKRNVEELLEYPDKYDQREVRPKVRANEITLNGLEPMDPAWAEAFWREAWETTPCFEFVQPSEHPEFGDVITRQAVQELHDKLSEHWSETHETTAVDARHDAVFGMAFFALRTLEEMMGIGNGTGILGRLGLRTILEIRINLHYMMEKDTPEIWARWREYGAGQAKLNVLKFSESVEAPEFIDLETIESIASEDVWEEFVNVNLASWTGHNLRKLSERADVKPEYDQYYSWTSAYAHGMWGSIRESSFQVCSNPLHRLHRRPERMSLGDTVEDAARLVDDIIRDVAEAYPEFEWRLSAFSREQTSIPS